MRWLKIKNSGIYNEYMFIKELNNKRINDLSFLLQELIYILFPNTNDNKIVKCYKNKKYEKADICINIGRKTKYISIKTGTKNSVHCESINKFISFLRKIGISWKSIDEILKYQYADGTTNGSGRFRLPITEYKKYNKCSIDLVNKELNNDKILKELVKRFVLKGTKLNLKKIDGIIYGTPYFFYYINRKDLLDYILYKSDVKSSSIHFSCLTFQPLSRVLDYNYKFEYRRHWIQIKWYNLEDNIIELLNQKCIKDLNN